MAFAQKGMQDVAKLKMSDANLPQRIFAGAYKKHMLKAKGEEKVARHFSHEGKRKEAAGRYFAAGAHYANAAYAAKKGKLGYERTHAMGIKSLTNFIRAGDERSAWREANPDRWYMLTGSLPKKTLDKNIAMIGLVEILS